ncbi:hypothetical protein MMC13_002212 [Lambiella insularis]|nr:hypothetical protein [Lambiella insularis]
MSLPTTPSKKGEEINRIVWDLNSKWGLELPIRSAPQSPSKIPNPHGRAEKICNRIRFLFFRDNEALQTACKRFDHHAKQISAQWIYKPRADTDTLPSRATGSSLQNESWLKRNDVDENTRNALEETLLRFLTEAAGELSNPTVVLPPINHGLGVYQDVAGQLARMNQALLTPFAGRFSSAMPVSPFEPTSSAAFNADSDTVDAMEDLLAADSYNPFILQREISNFSTEPGHVRSESLGDADVFSTPPSTPPRKSPTETKAKIHYDVQNSKVYTDHEMTDLYLCQEDDTLILPDPTRERTRKRSAPEYPQIRSPPKTNFELRSRQLPQTYGVHHLQPADMARSFDSFLTTTSSTVPSTPRTTQSTSFDIESATTSFGRSTSDQASDQLLKEQEVRDEMTRKMLIKAQLDSSDDMLDVVTHSTKWVGDTFSESRKGMFDSPSHARKRLQVTDPFGPLNAQSWPSLPMRQLYEISRIVLHYKVPISDLPMSVHQSICDYDKLWSRLTSITQHGQVMPERSAAEAWVKAESKPENVVFAGDLTFGSDPRGPIFQFQLKPLKTDRSYRLGRKSGGDRFFVLGIPGLGDSDLPHHLRNDATNVRSAIITWLLEDDHHLLGRTWRAFFVKSQQTTTKVRKTNLTSFNSIRHRIFLFAVNGLGFRRRTRLVDATREHQPSPVEMPVSELIQYVMPLDKNMDQLCLKLFARIALAVSSTIPTLVFKPSEIIRTTDAVASAAKVRMLSTDRYFVENDRNMSQLPSAVMNDGCARISRGAAFAIANMLGLTGQMPSVYQGRLGGAKGIWMVDALDEKVIDSDRETWIEITDSQLKFNGHSNTDYAMLTFEVSAYSRPLSSAALNYQLMPILIERGVPGNVFERLLEADLTAKVEDLEMAMNSGLALRKWNQENSSIAGQRVQSSSVEMLGGLPHSLAEKINCFVEHGFELKTNRLLRDLCRRAIKMYCERLETRMNIGLGQSTYAFMIADPLAVLEENELHLGFSSAFKDEHSGFNDTILNGMDVLVARLPAHLPSDIQKVRAVFKPQLAYYKDVIVFSSKGQCSLASKLSGGDYDGDQAWICWEPRLVEPFENAELHKAPDLTYYGITKDRTTVCDILQKPDPVSAFLHKGFEFNIQPTLLGVCTHYHEAHCYWGASINHPLSKDLASLLGLLVDSAKGGFMFTFEDWNDFKSSIGLRQSHFKPAYRNPTEAEPRPDSIIDRLVFVVAKDVRDKVLGRFSERFKDATDWDDDLNSVWKAEEALAPKHTPVHEVFTDLRARLKELYKFWAENSYHQNPDEGRPSRSTDASFKARVEQIREQFLAIQPLARPDCPMVKRWAEDQGSTKGAWSRLKASALYKQFWKYGDFIWYVAGKELMELKVLARGKASSVVEEIWRVYKLDTKLMKRLEGSECGRAADSAEVVEDDYGWDEDFEEFALPEE